MLKKLFTAVTLAAMVVGLCSCDTATDMRKFDPNRDQIISNIPPATICDSRT